MSRTREQRHQQIVGAFKRIEDEARRANAIPREGLYGVWAHYVVAALEATALYYPIEEGRDPAFAVDAGVTMLKRRICHHCGGAAFNGGANGDRCLDCARLWP